MDKWRRSRDAQIDPIGFVVRPGVCRVVADWGSGVSVLGGCTRGVRRRAGPPRQNGRNARGAPGPPVKTVKTLGQNERPRAPRSKSVKMDGQNGVRQN